MNLVCCGAPLSHRVCCLTNVNSSVCHGSMCLLGYHCSRDLDIGLRAPWGAQGSPGHPSAASLGRASDGVVGQLECRLNSMLAHSHKPRWSCVSTRLAAVQYECKSQVPPAVPGACGGEARDAPQLVRLMAAGTRMNGDHNKDSALRPSPSPSRYIFIQLSDLRETSVDAAHDSCQ